MSCISAQSRPHLQFYMTILLGAASLFVALSLQAADADPVPLREKHSLSADCAPTDTDVQKVEIDPGFTEQVMQQLAADQPAERAQALSQLSVKQPPVDPVLLQDMLYQGLNDPDIHVRAQAVYAMAKQGDVEYLSTLQQALADPELQVRLMLLDGLGKNEWGRLLLEQALQDDDAAVREFASEKLAVLALR